MTDGSFSDSAAYKGGASPSCGSFEAAANFAIDAGASAANAGRKLAADASSDATSTDDIRTCMIGVLRA